MTFKHWIHGLGAAFITGLSTAALSVLGVTTADQIGATVLHFSLGQIGAIALAGGIVGALAYLKQSPLPDDGEDEKKP